MLRQAVQTLTGRGGEQVEDSDDIYLSGYSPSEPQTAQSEDGTNNRQDELSTLQATVERLSQNYEQLNGRLADKDRFIGQLERENQRYEAMQSASAGRQPQPEPDPVLDAETAQLFAEKYKENPEKALVALAEHLDARTQGRMSEDQRRRDLVQQATASVQAAERNILRQVDLAVQDLGPAAAEVVGDFIDLVRRGNGTPQSFSETWLGRELQSDSAMARSTQGVYRLIELETLRRQGNTRPQAEAQTYQAQPARQSSSVMRPSAPSRNVSAPSDGTDNEISVEDRIAEAIVNAARGDDAQQRGVFLG